MEYLTGHSGPALRCNLPTLNQMLSPIQHWSMHTPSLGALRKLRVCFRRWWLLDLGDRFFPHAPYQNFKLTIVGVTRIWGCTCTVHANSTSMSHLKFWMWIWLTGPPAWRTILCLMHMPKQRKSKEQRLFWRRWPRIGNILLSNVIC